MKAKSLPFILVGAISLISAPVYADWTQSAAGTYDYGNSANWDGGGINGTFPGALSLTGSQTITFSSDTTLSTTGLKFDYTSAQNITFTGNGATARSLTLTGNITSAGLTTGARTIRLGEDGNANPLTILVNGSVRTVSSGANTTTIINAKVSGSSSLNQASGAGTVKFANDISDFTGDWSMGYGTTQFTSLADVGQASALGAGGAINFANGGSFGTFAYVGAGDSTSNRRLNFNGTTGEIGIQTLAGAGKLTLSGLLTMSANQTSNKTISFTANGGDIIVSGEINQPDTGVLSIKKNLSAGRLIISGTNNNYTGKTTVAGGVLEITSIRNVNGGASSLGAVTDVANGTISLGTAGNNGTLRYVGTGDSSNRVIDMAGTTGGATLDASGSGALVLTSNITTSGNGAKTLTLLGSSAADVMNTISGAISDSTGATSLSKGGFNTWNLTGVNTYTGATAVNQGLLLVNGKLANTSSVTVNNSGKLGGGGTIAAATTIKSGGTLAPGASSLTPVTLTINNNVKFEGGSIFAVNLDGNGNSSDKLVIKGNLDLSDGNNTLTLYLLNSAPVGDEFTLITFTGSLFGEFAHFTGLPDGYELSYRANSVVLTAVPEAHTVAMMLGGLGMLLGATRMQRRR